MGKTPKTANSGLTLPDFKTHHGATGIETGWQWRERDKQIDGIKYSPRKYDQLVFDKGGRQYSEAKMVFSTCDAGTARHPHARNMNLDTDFPPFTKLTQNGS